MKLYTFLTGAIISIVGGTTITCATEPSRVETDYGMHGNYSITISVDSSIFRRSPRTPLTFYFEATHLETGGKIRDSISSLNQPYASGEHSITLSSSRDGCNYLLLVNLSQPFQVDTLFKSCTPELNYWIQDTYFYAYSAKTGLLAISGILFGPREHWPTAITRIINGSALDTIRVVNATYPVIVSDGESILMATGAFADSTLFGVVLYEIKRDTLFSTPEDGQTRGSSKCACTGCPVFYITLDRQEERLKIMQWQPETGEDTKILQWGYPQEFGDYYVTRDTLYYSMRDMSKADTSWQTLSIELPK